MKISVWHQYCTSPCTLCYFYTFTPIHDQDIAYDFDSGREHHCDQNNDVSETKMMGIPNFAGLLIFHTVIVLFTLCIAFGSTILKWCNCHALNCSDSSQQSSIR
jgi:hypothetical protein